MTDDYLDLQLTASCHVEMKLLPVADSVSYICMVRTYSSPEKESVVTLYTQDCAAPSVFCITQTVLMSSSFFFRKRKMVRMTKTAIRPPQTPSTA